MTTKCITAMSLFFNHLNLIMKTFGIAMVFVYTGAGLLFLLSDYVTAVTGFYRPLLGTVLVLYAAFRGYIILKNHV